MECCCAQLRHATGLVGGAVAAINGGDFGEAAMTSAFRHLCTEDFSLTMQKGEGITRVQQGDQNAHVVARTLNFGPLTLIPIPIYPLVHTGVYSGADANGHYTIDGLAPEEGTGIPDVTGDATIQNDGVPTNPSDQAHDLGEYVVFQVPGTDGSFNADEMRQIVNGQQMSWDSNYNPNAPSYNLATNNCHDLSQDATKKYLKLNQ